MPCSARYGRLRAGMLCRRSERAGIVACAPPQSCTGRPSACRPPARRWPVGRQEGQGQLAMKGNYYPYTHWWPSRARRPDETPSSPVRTSCQRHDPRANTWPVPRPAHRPSRPSARPPTVWKATMGGASNQRMLDASGAWRGSTPKRAGRDLSYTKGEPPSFTIACTQRRVRRWGRISAVSEQY